MLTRCLARALAPSVTVNAIAPGTISFPNDSPELADLYVQRTPLGRTGAPENIADAVMYFVERGVRHRPNSHRGRWALHTLLRDLPFSPGIRNECVIRTMRMATSRNRRGNKEAK